MDSSGKKMKMKMGMRGKGSNNNNVEAGKRKEITIKKKVKHDSNSHATPPAHGMKKLKPTTKQDVGNLDFDKFIQASFGNTEEARDDHNPDKDDDNDNHSSSSDEEERHKRELAQLAEKDPEFHAHLNAEAKYLLEFGKEEDNDDHASIASSTSSTASPSKSHTTTTTTTPLVSLTATLLTDLTHRAFKSNDAKSLRELIRYFKASTKPDTLATLTDSVAVHHKLITAVVSECHHAFDALILPSRTVPSQKQRTTTTDLSTYPAFKYNKHTIKAFLVSLTTSILQSSGNATVEQILLEGAKHYVPYYMAQDFVSNEGKKFGKALVTIWSREQTSGPSRLSAYMSIQQCCQARPKELLEELLRSMYVAFARAAAVPSNPATRDRLAIQTRCLVDMMGLDMNISYRLAFQYIRQLALHLRTAMASKTNEALRAVDSWQFLSCLRLWGFVLARHHPALEELEFPLIQVALGTIELINSSRFAPLRLHCIDLVDRLCRETGSFASTVQYSLDVLFSPDLFKSEKPTMDKAPDFDLTLRLREDALRTGPCRDVICARAVKCIRFHLELYRCSVSFPELWILPRNKLEQWKKDVSSIWKRKHSKRTSTNKKLMMEKPTWITHTEKAVDGLLRDGDRWSTRVIQARDGLVQGVTRPNGPADIEGCARFEEELKIVDKVVGPVGNEELVELVDRSADKSSKSSSSVVVKQNNKKTKKSGKEKKVVEEKDDDEDDDGVSALRPEDWL